MEVSDADLAEFKEWLFLKGVRPVDPAKIDVTEEPLRDFEAARMGTPGKGNKAGKPFAIWWGDFYVCDFGAYRLVYDVLKPQP
jgi:hypothetical protein